jgi:endonuclease/exonuclease/phosphatase family metal-dependent hydrolase
MTNLRLGRSGDGCWQIVIRVSQVRFKSAMNCSSRLYSMARSNLLKIVRLARAALCVSALVISGCGNDRIVVSDAIEWRPGPIGPITVMTYNVLCPVCSVEQPWTRRLPMITRLIARHQPDLIAAQELIIPLDAEHFRGALPRPAGTDAPVYERICRVNCDNVAYYRIDRLELLENGSIELTRFPYRFAAWAVFRERRTGTEFMFVYTHFDNKQPNQERSADRLRAALQPWIDRQIPILVAGDFNASPSGASQVHDGHQASQTGYRMLAEFLKNTYQLAGLCYIYTNHPESDTNAFLFDNMIDHIFVSSPSPRGSFEWKVHSWGVDYWWATDGIGPRPQYPSDHWPVLTRLAFNSRSGEGTTNSECKPSIAPLY